MVLLHTMTAPSRLPALHSAARGVLDLLPARLRAWLAERRARHFCRQFHFARTPRWQAAIEHTPWTIKSPTATPGFNLIGYLKGEFGLAEAARAYARAALMAGVPVSLHDVDLPTPHSHRDVRLEAHLSSSALAHGVDAVFVNPDNFAQAIDQPVQRARPRRHLMGFWFWELPRVPEAWGPAIDLVDEILVASDYVAEAFRARTSKRVTKIPYPLFRPTPSHLTRADFGLPADAFVFLVSFDFNSSIQRKNPAAAIAAFRAAFPPERGDVALVVKSSNGQRNAAGLAELVSLAGSDPRILIRDDVLVVDHVHALQACCDAYVSLHRAEGLGLGLAECMSLGKPVIATRWSGNLEYMTEAVSLLVDARLVAVPPGEYPHADGQQWAEPDVAHAARLMRKLADDRDLAAAMGAAAARHVDVALAPARTAQILGERLRQLANQDGDEVPFLRGVRG